MKFFRISLFFAWAMLWFSAAQASHVMGAEITWESHSKDSIKVILTAYFDCNGITTYGHDITVSSKSKTKKYPTKLFKGKDITPTCRSVCTRCYNSSCSFAYGILEYKYYTWVNLDSFGTDCELVFSYTECCRNSSITTGAASQNFFVESMHNRCLAPGDNSPVTKYSPIMIIGLGRDFSYDGGTIDSDLDTNGFALDSIGYALYNPRVSSTSKAYYSGSYSYTSPIYYLGFPKTKKKFPRGFHFDTSTCQMLFRPMKTEVTVLGIQTNSYRNGKLAGYIQRDLQIIVIKTPDNVPPLISGANCSNPSGKVTNITACANQTIDFTVCTTDKDKDDTLTLSVPNHITGSKVSVTSGQHPSVRFKWTPQASQARKEPYTLVVHVADNACPVRGEASRVFNIYVTNDSVPPKLSFSQNNKIRCGEYRIDYTSAMPLDSFKWFLDDTLRSVDTFLAFDAQRFGKIPVRLDVKSDQCWYSYYDTVDVQKFNKIKLSKITALGLCDPKQLDTTFSATGGYGKLSYSWTAASLTKTTNNDTIKLSYSDVNKYDVVTYTATDTANCSVSDTFGVLVTAKTAHKVWHDTLLCQDSTAHFALPLANKTLGNWTGPGVKRNRFSSDTLKDGRYTLNFLYGSYGKCWVDEVVLTVSHKPKLSTWSDLDTLCSNHRSIYLHGRPAKGKWFGHSNAPDSIFTEYNSPDSSYQLYYTYQNALGCSQTDTHELVIKDYPLHVKVSNDSSFCFKEDTLYLKASPAGGKWKNSSYLDTSGGSTFVVLPNSDLNLTLTYTYEDSKKCFETKKVTYNQKEAYEVKMPRNKKTCFGSASQIKIKEPSPSGGTFSGPNLSKSGGEYIYKINSQSIGKHYLTYSITTAKGCTTTDSMKVIVFEPKKLKTLSDTGVCTADGNIYVPLNDATGNWNKPGWFYTQNDSLFLETDKLSLGKNELFYITLDSNLCQSKAGFNIQLFTTPLVQAMSDTSLCLNPVQELLLKATPASGNWIGKNLKTSNDSSFFSSARQSEGRYTFFYNYVDSNHCAASDEVNIDLRSLPFVEAGADDSLCADSGNYYLTPITAGGHWLDSSVLSDSSGNYIYFDSTQTGTKYYVYELTDAYGCKATDTFALTKMNKIKAGFKVSATAGNKPFKVQFSPLRMDSSLYYLWNFGDGT
ncbi:hypothetical protein GC194_07560, partial [bacterium]|nr:hypothetical protein [bacterium]